MKIAILSRNSKSYSTQRLIDAAAARNHEARVLDTLALSALVSPNDPRVLYHERILSPHDVVLPRIGASITFEGLSMLRQLEAMGVPTLASADAIAVSRDKLRSLQVFASTRIPFPESIFVSQSKLVPMAIERLGGAPIIIKLLEGTQGVGVILAESAKSAEAIVETLIAANRHVLLQKFISESRGRDIRAFVVKGRVVAAMKRTARGEEFRSNVHRGGKTEAVILDREFEHVAVRAAAAMGLVVAGVDLLESKSGPLVMEVNSSPGLEGIETATGIDVADEIIRALESFRREELPRVSQLPA